MAIKRLKLAQLLGELGVFLTNRARWCMVRITYAEDYLCTAVYISFVIPLKKMQRRLIR
jgi:hypothetical protein